jgi:hypothetical protein
LLDHVATDDYPNVEQRYMMIPKFNLNIDGSLAKDRETRSMSGKILHGVGKPNDPLPLNALDFG